MKRGIYFLLCACMLVACSEQKIESQETVIEPQKSEEFNSVLNSIASLNDKFGCDDMITRSDIRNFLYQVADYAGGYYGARLGGECGLYAGSATGSPATAIVLGAAGTMLGGIAGSVAASYLFDLLWPNDGYSKPSINQPGSIDDIAFGPYEDSPGLVHNTILYTLENNGENYIDDEGNVLVEELYRDALAYEENLHLDDVVINSDYINEVELFCKDLYATIKDAKNQELADPQICDVIYDLLRVKGCSGNDVMELKAIGNALLPCVSLDEDEVPAYELEFNDIIKSSKLDDCEKDCLATAGSIYIHSVKYWY